MFFLIVFFIYFVVIFRAVVKSNSLKAILIFCAVSIVLGLFVVQYSFYPSSVSASPSPRPAQFVSRSVTPSPTPSWNSSVTAVYRSSATATPKPSSSSKSFVSFLYDSALQKQSPTATPKPSGSSRSYASLFSSSESQKKSPTATPSATKTYILNTNTKKFHLPSCSSVKQMKDSNKRTYTGTRQSVLNMGYEPCQRCYP